MPTDTQPRQRPVKLKAHQLLFPAAAIHAAIIVPLSILAMTSAVAWPAGLAAGHGREMLFGFALALVTGYLLGPQPRARLYAVFALWLAARLGHLLMPDSLATGSLNLLFALVAVWLIAPKLMAAKKWRNRVIGPLIACLFLLPVLYMVTVRNLLLQPAAVLHVAVILLGLLMALMGGRILSAAAAGEFYRQGRYLEARVQPRLEGIMIVLLGAAAVAVVALPLAAGLCLIATGAVTGIRLARWRLWHCRDRADLMALGAGYGWLVTGLLAMGLALITGSGFSHAMHVVTIGALGTLSISIAARVHLESIKATRDHHHFYITAALLIAAAMLLRLLTGLWPGLALIGASALAWSLAYCLLAGLLLYRPA